MTSSRGLKDRSQSKLGQRNASCLYKPPSTTRSTFNAILFPATCSASSEEKRCRSGEQRPRLELEPSVLPTFVWPEPSYRDSTGSDTPLDPAAYCRRRRRPLISEPGRAV